MMRAVFSVASIASVAVAAAVAVVISGCHSPAGDEARSLIAAVDRFRAAESTGKPSALAAIEAASCTDAEVCAAKDACLRFARPTSSGLVRKSAVEQGVSALESGTSDGGPSAADLASTLEKARHELEEGHAALDDCDKRSRELRLKYAR